MRHFEAQTQALERRVQKQKTSAADGLRKEGIGGVQKG